MRFLVDLVEVIFLFPVIIVIGIIFAPIFLFDDQYEKHEVIE